MAKYLTNAFSLQMLETDQPHTIHTVPMTVTETAEALRGGYTSAIGHVDTAAVVSALLGTAVPCSALTCAWFRATRFSLPSLQEAVCRRELPPCRRASPSASSASRWIDAHSLSVGN